MDDSIEGRGTREGASSPVQKFCPQCTMWSSSIIVRREVDERDAIDMLKWFNKNYEGEITSDQFRTFFPAIGTGQHLSDMVFRSAEGTKINLSSCVYFYICTGLWIETVLGQLASWRWCWLWILLGQTSELRMSLYSCHYITLQISRWS